MSAGMFRALGLEGFGDLGFGGSSSAAGRDIRDSENKLLGVKAGRLHLLKEPQGSKYPIVWYLGFG